MPYITQALRDTIGPIDYRQVFISNAGTLNYAITKLIHEYLKQQRVCYTSINEVIGVLECAKLELYRQIAAPYEDVKKAENGSVSNLDKEKKDG